VFLEVTKRLIVVFVVSAFAIQGIALPFYAANVRSSSFATVVVGGIGCAALNFEIFCCF